MMIISMVYRLYISYILVLVHLINVFRYNIYSYGQIESKTNDKLIKSHKHFRD